MVLGAEIGLLIFGLIGLFTGKLTLSKTRVVHGTPARLLGIIAVAPLPLSFVAGVVLAMVLAAQGRDPATDRGFQGAAIAIELGILALCLILFFVIGTAVAKRQEAQALDEEADEE